MLAHEPPPKRKLGIGEVGEEVCVCTAIVSPVADTESTDLFKGIELDFSCRWSTLSV